MIATRRTHLVRIAHLAARLAAASLLPSIATLASAQAQAPQPAPSHGAYPDKPIKWLVGYPAGGGSDFLARTVGEQMSEQMKQPFVIENKPGPGGMVAAEIVAKSPGDGYTVFTADNGILVYNPVMYKKLGYNPDKDFAPLGLIARIPLMLATTPLVAQMGLPALMTSMKATPAKYTYSSPGIGSPHHLTMELFKSHAGLVATHVPSRGAGAAIQAVTSGQAPMMVVDVSSGMAAIKSGALVPLMSFSARRHPLFPQVPTARELGFREVEAYAWQGLVVPASTPQPVRDRLSNEMQAAMRNPEMRKKLLDAGWDLNPTGALLMSVYIMAEKAKWHTLIKARAITAEIPAP